MKIPGFTIEARSILRTVKMLSDGPLGGKADAGHVSTADSLTELISRVILCEQTIILDNLHHLFNALAHVGVAIQQLHP